LIELNGGTKFKPLPYNVDNVDYTGPKRFEGPAQWNDLFWLVEELRDFVKDFCQEHNLDPTEARYTPGEAMKIVAMLE
jgi:hypothetical protein